MVPYGAHWRPFVTGGIGAAADGYRLIEAAGVRDSTSLAIAAL
jgi:hypothetical protein